MESGGAPILGGLSLIYIAMVAMIEPSVPDASLLHELSASSSVYCPHRDQN